MDKQPHPHPRMRKDPRFLEVVDQVYAVLAGQTQPEHVELGSAPGEPGRTRGLPDVSINQLAGLLEHAVYMHAGRDDIFRLAEDLKVNSDHLLRLMEAAELLGFATITQGDVVVTPLGETFAEASILARKEIFAARMKRLPIIKWLLSMLTAADEHRLEGDVVRAALELDFPQEEAARQLNTAVVWGRYAELLAYDDNTERIYLETGGGFPLSSLKRDEETGKGLGP